MRPNLLLPALIGVSLMSGCASFNAMPDPVLTVPATNAMLAPYSVTQALKDVQAETDKKAYRNRVIAAYLAASDARYLSFLRSLSRQTKGSNFGLDVASLSLSSIAAIAKGAANELSTGAAIATGARGSLNKEVYFEKTLPALVSAMEARRLEVRAEIERRMKADDVATYTLEQGFADIMRYQMATTLDGAIQEITSSAGKKETEAQQEYKNAVQSCSPPVELRPVWGKINDRAYGLAEEGQPTSDKLAAAAAAVGAEKKTDSMEQAAAITIVARGKCTVAEAEALLALLPAN